MKISLKSGMIFWLLLLAGCASRQHYQLQDLPLPANNSEGCCWQATQQLEIHYRQSVYQLNAALAHTATGARLVLLDPMGRRLLSIQQTQGQLDVYRAPELPEELPARFLLASSMLAWWPLVDWQGELRTTEWLIDANEQGRVLRFRGHPLLTAHYTPTLATPVAGAGQMAPKQRILLEHKKIPLRIHVTTTQWQPL